VYVDSTLTDAALDAAAPAKPTSTALQCDGTHGVVTASTAQQLTAVRRHDVITANATASYAPPAVRAQRSRLLVGLAVIRRRVDVEQIVFGWTAAAAAALSSSASGWCPGRRPAAAGRCVRTNQPRAGTVERRLDRRVVLGPQTIADFTEVGQLVPASSHVTRAGHAVTLAGRPGVLVDGLQTCAHKPHSNAFVYKYTDPIQSIFIQAKCPDTQVQQDSDAYANTKKILPAINRSIMQNVIVVSQ